MENHMEKSLKIIVEKEWSPCNTIQQWRSKAPSGPTYFTWFCFRTVQLNSGMYRAFLPLLVPEASELLSCTVRMSKPYVATISSWDFGACDRASYLSCCHLVLSIHSFLDLHTTSTANIKYDHYIIAEAYIYTSLWDPLRTRAVPERLRSVITTRLQIHTGLARYLSPIYISDIYQILSFENIGYFRYFQFLSTF